MGKLDGYTPRAVIKVAEDRGWRFVRQTGSHAIYVHAAVPSNLSIPMHDPVPAGLLKAILRKMGVGTATFVAEARK